MQQTHILLYMPINETLYTSKYLYICIYIDPVTIYQWLINYTRLNVIYVPEQHIRIPRYCWILPFYYHHYRIRVRYKSRNIFTLLMNNVRHAWSAPVASQLYEPASSPLAHCIFIIFEKCGLLAFESITRGERACGYFDVSAPIKYYRTIPYLYIHWRHSLQYYWLYNIIYYIILYYKRTQYDRFYYRHNMITIRNNPTAVGKSTR